MSYGDGDLIRDLRAELRASERKVVLLEARIAKAWTLRAQGRPVREILEALRAPEEKEST